MERRTQISIWYFLIAFLAVVWLRELWVTMQQVEPIPYSEFERHLEAGDIKEITIGSGVIRGVLKAPLPDGRRQFVTTQVDPALAKELDQYDIKYQAVVKNTFFRDPLSWVVPAIAFFAVWMLVIKRLVGQGGIGGQFLSIGKSKARVYIESDTKVTFDDVAGVDG